MKLIERRLKLILPLLAAFSLITGCSGKEEDRQPSAAEIREYTARIDRAEAEAKAKAIRESRAVEEARDRQARARVPAQN